MSVDMYVSSSQNQASSVSTMCKSQAEGYQELQKAITDFTGNAPFLTGKAYDSAKAYFQSVLYPLAQGGILLSEAVEKAVKKFPQEYISQVDSGNLKQSELEEKIRQANRLLNQAEDIRRELNSSKTPDITKSFQLNANSMLIGMYSASKQKLEEQLRKLLAFNASSPNLFSEIAGLQSAVNSGLAQTKTAWNGATGTFTIPKDLSWRDTIGDKWKLYQDNIHGINEKKNKELAKYNVYAVIYTDADGNPKISWQIEDKKTGYGITNSELYRYLSKAGNYLDSDLIQFMTYDAYDKKIKSGWRNGINYVTGEKLNPVLGGIVAGSQYIEDGVNWINESELGQAIQILGFTYASYKITTSSGTKQVNNGKIEGNRGAGNVDSNSINDGNSTVGRWMSNEEYIKMTETGKVQMSPNGNRTYVAIPPSKEAFPSAPTGSLYTEFNVNSNSIYPAGNENWAQIPGPGSLIDRLNQKKGLPPITEMPNAINIKKLGGK